MRHRRKLAVCVLSAFLGVVWFLAAPRSAQAQGYPGGVRDEYDWYLCGSVGTSETTTHVWGQDIFCEQYHFTYDSGLAQFVGEQWVSEVVAFGYAGSGQRAQRNAVYIVPPRGVERYGISCSGSVVADGSGTGSSAASFQLTDPGFFNDDGTYGSPYTVFETASTVTSDFFDIVGYMRAESYDRFWSQDPGTGWDTSSGYSGAPHLLLEASSNAVTGGSTAGYSCQIDYWNEWDTPPWDEWEPGEDDLLPTPTPDVTDTPTPTPTGTLTPSPTATATVTPTSTSTATPTFTPTPTQTPLPFLTVVALEPVTGTVPTMGLTFDDTSCYVIIPHYGPYGPISFLSNDATFEVPEYELCFEAYELELEAFGINFGVWAYAVVLIGGLGMLLMILRT